MASNPVAEMQAILDASWEKQAESWKGSVPEEDENGVVHLRNAEGTVVLSMSRAAWDAFQKRANGG